jgi:hypothetical protein
MGVWKEWGEYTAWLGGPRPENTPEARGFREPTPGGPVSGLRRGRKCFPFQMPLRFYIFSPSPPPHAGGGDCVCCNFDRAEKGKSGHVASAPSQLTI